MTDKHPPDHTTTQDSRLARLEEGYTTLGREVHSLGQAMRELPGGIRHEVNESFSQVHASIAGLTEKISRRGETNWGVYFSGIGVLIAFIVSVGTAAMAPLYLMTKNNDIATQRVAAQVKERLAASTASHATQLTLMRADIAATDDALIKHQLLDGHPTAMAKHAEHTSRTAEHRKFVENALQDMDAKLQIEMRLADDTVAERIESLDSKLQQEIRANTNVSDDDTAERRHRELLEVMKAK